MASVDKRKRSPYSVRISQRGAEENGGRQAHHETTCLVLLAKTPSFSHDILCIVSA